MQHILIYDDNHINYKKGYMMNIELSSPPISCATIGGRHVALDSYSANLYLAVSNYEESDNITLDETTMKRIAKYNKEMEIKRLDEEIEKKKAKIKELDDVLSDKGKRVQKIKEFVANIYDIDIEDDEEDWWD